MPRADMNLRVKGRCSFSCLVIGPTTFSCHTNSADYGQRIQDSLEQLKHAVKATRSFASAVGEADVRSPTVKVPESAEVSSHVITDDGRKDTVQAVIPEAVEFKTHDETTMQQPEQPNEHDDLSKAQNLDALKVSLRHLDIYVGNH